MVIANIEIADVMMLSSMSLVRECVISATARTGRTLARCAAKPRMPARMQE